MKGQPTINANRTQSVVSACIRLYTLVLILSFSINSAQTQDSLFTFLFELPEKAKDFTTDKLRQCYLVTENNEVIKYNADGKELFRFNNNRLGEMSYIDATDPFNILLYYPEFRTVILLDRTLNVTNEYILYDLDVVEIHAVGLSNDNNIWIYDDVNFKMKKVNQNGETLLESDNLSMILGVALQPNFILERNNWVFVNDADIGVLQFDLFGTYVKTIDIKSLAQFQVLEDQLVYRDANMIHTLHLKSLSNNTIDIPVELSKEDAIRIQKDRLYVLKDQKVSLYTF